MENSNFRNKNEIENSDFRKESKNTKSGFRYNPKCSFHDSGYCKFGEKCRKQHYNTVCLDPNCDKNCKSRHPRICKFKAKCKFFAKNVCAYKHVTLACGDSDLNALKLQVKSLQLENEAKLSKIIQLEEETKIVQSKIEALEEEKEISSKLVKELKDTITLLEKENVDLKVQTIIQHKIIGSFTDQSEMESYNCENCDFECDEEDGLETHKELFHENGVEVDETTSENQNRDDENFDCDKCHLKFAGKNELNKHKKAMHCSLISF